MVSYRLLLGFTAVIGVILVCRPVTVSGDMSEDASLCSQTIKSGFDSILAMIAKRPQIDPIFFEANTPFTGCYFHGISGMITLGECPSEKIGECISIIHTVTLRIVEAKLVCGCELKSNPAESLKEVVALTKKKNMGMPCNMTDEKLKQYKPDKIDPTTMMKIEELMKCEECAGIIDVKKAAGKMPTSFGGLADTAKANAKAPPEKVKGDIITIWPNVDLQLQFILDVATGLMKPQGGKLLSKNVDDIEIQCVGSELVNGEDLFQAPCKCLKKANFMKIFLLQFLELMFPCYCDAGAGDMMKAAGDKTDGIESLTKTVFAQISCKEIYC